MLMNKRVSLQNISTRLALIVVILEYAIKRKKILGCDKMKVKNDFILLCLANSYEKDFTPARCIVCTMKLKSHTKKGIKACEILWRRSIWKKTMKEEV
jgi:hypothetical protein